MRARKQGAERLAAFGLRLREIRLTKGWSQEDLAERAGLHRTYIGGVERGERNPSVLNVFALADALEVDVRELFAVI